MSKYIVDGEVYIEHRFLKKTIKIDEIVDIAYNQQQKYNKNIKRSDVEESVEKILSIYNGSLE